MIQQFPVFICVNLCLSVAIPNTDLTATYVPIICWQQINTDWRRPVSPRHGLCRHKPWRNRELQKL